MTYSRRWNNGIRPRNWGPADEQWLAEKMESIDKPSKEAKRILAQINLDERNEKKLKKLQIKPKPDTDVKMTQASSNSNSSSFTMPVVIKVEPNTTAQQMPSTAVILESLSGNTNSHKLNIIENQGLPMQFYRGDSSKIADSEFDFPMDIESATDVPTVKEERTSPFRPGESENRSSLMMVFN